VVRVPVLIQEIEARPGDNPHTILTFHNAAGRLKSAPVWANEQHRIEHVTRGQAVEVTGVIGRWRNRPQLQVHSLRILPADEIAWDELHPSIGDPRPWWQILDHWRGVIRNPRLAATLALFFDDDGFRRRFEQCPASLTGHHARLGGLLQHTYEVARLTKAIAAFTPQANSDLLLAGALLHDIGKIESYRWEGLFDTTVEGRVIGHVVLGARMLDRVAAPSTACLSEELDALQHLILSHHGRLEFGAPILPLCLEAEILAHADLVSARTASFAEALANPTLFRADEQFSARPVWEIDQRRLWRGIRDAGSVPRA
jgi:3'-5' exoribonuclease